MWLVSHSFYSTSKHSTSQSLLMNEFVFSSLLTSFSHSSTSHCFRDHSGLLLANTPSCSGSNLCTLCTCKRLRVITIKEIFPSFPKLPSEDLLRSLNSEACIKSQQRRRCYLQGWRTWIDSISMKGLLHVCINWIFIPIPMHNVNTEM